MADIKRVVFERTDTTVSGWNIISGKDFDSLDGCDQTDLILKGWCKSGNDYYRSFECPIDLFDKYMP